MHLHQIKFLNICPSYSAGATGPASPRWEECYLNCHPFENISPKEIPKKIIKEAQHCGLTESDCITYLETINQDPTWKRYTSQDMLDMQQYFHVLFCDYADLPLYISSKISSVRIIAATRLELGI